MYSFLNYRKKEENRMYWFFNYGTLTNYLSLAKYLGTFVLLQLFCRHFGFPFAFFRLWHVGVMCSTRWWGDRAGGRCGPTGLSPGRNCSSFRRESALPLMSSGNPLLPPPHPHRRPCVLHFGFCKVNVLTKVHLWHFTVPLVLIK